MPHVSSGGGGDDLGSTDEVKVFKDEGEDEKRSSENLTEDKTSLIVDLTESEVCRVECCVVQLTSWCRVIVVCHQVINHVCVWFYLCRGGGDNVRVMVKEIMLGLLLVSQPITGDLHNGEHEWDVFICFSGKERFVTRTELYIQQECVAVRS